MKIGGLVKNSFVDYPGLISCVIFTVGCNFRCWYCHNSHLFQTTSKYSQEEVFEFLTSHKNFLDGVVVSGGEPTLQPDLVDFISRIKGLGYKVKLDTNGTNFEVLKYLVDNKLVDYVAMDIKAPLEKYAQIVKVGCDVESIKKSINYLLTCDIDYEFRTTFSPDLNTQDIESICKTINGAKNYSIQKYNQVEYNNFNMPEKKREEHFLAQEIAKKYVKNVIVKGVD